MRDCFSSFGDFGFISVLNLLLFHHVVKEPSVVTAWAWLPKSVASLNLQSASFSQSLLRNTANEPLTGPRPGLL
jgi:hypothetical protein